MPDSETSSADPAARIAYSEAGLRLDAELDVWAIRLRAVLDEFAATCTEYHTGIHGSLADGLRDLAQRNRELSQGFSPVCDHGLVSADQAVQGSPFPCTLDGAY